MLMQNLGGQTKSIMVFSELAYNVSPRPYPRYSPTMSWGPGDVASIDWSIMTRKEFYNLTCQVIKKNEIK